MIINHNKKIKRKTTGKSTQGGMGVGGLPIDLWRKIEIEKQRKTCKTQTKQSGLHMYNKDVRAHFNTVPIQPTADSIVDFYGFNPISTA